MVLVGTYPRYSLISFPDPKSGSGATLAVYEASPTAPRLDFGRFAASTKTSYRKLGSARLASVSDVSLGSHVGNFGAYVGRGTTPITGGSVTLRGVDSFDVANALPFHNASRISLFVLDPLAECLAAYEHATRCGTDAKKWAELLTRVAERAGPSSGFLLALRMNHAAYGPAKGFPEVTFPD